MYIIYMHTSLDSGKSYIGLTSRTMVNGRISEIKGWALFKKEN